MSRYLDPRFALVIEFMASARTNAERQAGRETAEEIARAGGYTFDEALATLLLSAKNALICIHLPDAAHLSTFAGTPPPIAVRGLSAQRAAEVVAALSDGPGRSDRDVARACGCSPTLVGRARAAAGLATAAREIRRGGQCYEMRSKSIAAGGSDQIPSPGHLGESPAANMRKR